MSKPGQKSSAHVRLPAGFLPGPFGPRLAKKISQAGKRNPYEIIKQVPRRRVTVKRFCLYSTELDRLRELCHGQARLESTVVRFLIRNAPNLSELDLKIARAEDYRDHQIEGIRRDLLDVRDADIEGGGE